MDFTSATKRVVKAKPAKLSERARELARLKEIAQSMPEARSEKVDEIRKAVLNGTYTVSGTAVAESLLEELLIERFC